MIIPANATVTARVPVQEARALVTIGEIIVDPNTIRVEFFEPEHLRKIVEVKLHGVRSDETLRYSAFKNCNQTATTQHCTLVKVGVPL